MTTEPTSTKKPVRPPRVGSARTCLYDATGLHHGDVVEQTPVELFETDAEGAFRVLAPVRRGALYRDPATDDVWFHPWNGQPRVVGHDSETGPGGDPAGDVAAWFEGDVLVVYDTAHDREISRTTEEPVLDYATWNRAAATGSGTSRPRRSCGGPEKHLHRLDLTTGTSSIVWEGLSRYGNGSKTSTTALGSGSASRPRPAHGRRTRDERAPAPGAGTPASSCKLRRLIPACARGRRHGSGSLGGSGEPADA